MEIAIIADDLTGANDTGVQLARRGLRTSVLLKLGSDASINDREMLEAVVIDTDSRASSQEEAYMQVRAASEYIKQSGCKVIYKKMDSTMRGNIGPELDAVYDALAPDFIGIAPAFPQSGRLVRDGILYVNGKPVHETAAGIDPKTPVRESHIPSLLRSQTGRTIGHIGYMDISKGIAYIQQKLNLFHNQQIRYVVFDTTSDADLKTIASCLEQTQFNVVWAGSAGLANYVPLSKSDVPAICLEQNDELATIPKQSVLLVIGSVNEQSRKQLDFLLNHHDSVKAVKLQSHTAVEGSTMKGLELDRVCREAEQALQQGLDVVIFSSGDKTDIDEANEAGIRVGLNPTAVSQRIADTLGEAAVYLMNHYSLQGVIMTGGDTAKQVCLHWEASRFDLLDEIESGVPIGLLIGEKSSVNAITKSGGFGTEQVLFRAIERLRQEATIR
ncbi:four-carbon acid sugar kinase family protein [Paenibacillus foliorum]|uniref:four-carbon acid sugar kinase family protein n=1 Tax=Paenibacillus foliorum TaxID=2654974 RepID=UPI0014931F45|nr:four-carbon acid sugar kinase family protein [Paenibacillus foliorum]